MPRIDPQQLLNTLGALLSPDGSIKSPEEADRLVKLMNKFSRKLVSKCIYVQILRATSRDLLGKFLEEGGWKLLNTWFDDAIKALNWPLVTELLHLFLACPVTASLLKDNAAEHQAPKLINQLRSQANSNISATVKNLAGEIYKKWVSVVSNNSAIVVKNETSNESNGSLSLLQTLASEVSESLKKETSSVLQNRKVPTVQKPKSTIIDGSIKINKKNLPTSHPLKLPKSGESKESSHEKRKRSSTDHKSDKERKKFRPDHRDEVKPEEKQRIKDMARKLKEEAEKAKASKVEKSSSSIISKMPKIPKKVPPSGSAAADASKKPGLNRSFEEMLGGLDSKPKTVKTPLAKNKTAQLLEGMKVSSSSSKSSKSSSKKSSHHHHDSKKDHHDSKKDHHHSSKSSKSEKPTEKKLTQLVMPTSSSLNDKKKDSDSPKASKSPSTSYSESSSFMDSLLFNMSGKSRRTTSKRRNSESESSKATTPPKVAKKEKINEDDKKESDEESKKESPVAQTFSFYVDTLETKEEEPSVEKKDDETNGESKPEPVEETNNESNAGASEEKVKEDLAFEEPETMPREVKGILVYHRGREKRDKKITWRSESDLVQVQYFEVDENERVNVNKLKFENMREMESRMEKEAVKNKSSMSDNEESAPLLDWYKPVPIIVDNREPFIPGSNSKEKEVQAHREKGVLQALYFNREMTPNDPAEADPEMAKTQAPTIIPLEDQENDSNSNHSYQNNGWPEPKENQVSQQASLESQFSLPPALSSLLSSINKNGLEAIIPPPTALSKEEQDTLAAQTEAMKKLGILPQGVPSLNEPPPHQPQTIRPEFQRFPPPMNGGINNPAWSQFNGPPMNGPPEFNHGFNNQPPRFNNGGGFSRNGRGHNNQNHGYRTNGGPQHNNRGGTGGFYRENRWDDRKIGTRPCKFYSGKGTCRDGDTCRFIHESPMQRADH